MRYLGATVAALALSVAFGETGLARGSRPSGGHGGHSGARPATSRPSRPATTHRPAPAVANHRPPAVNHRPPAVNHRPPAVSNHRPPTVSKRPPMVTNHRPTNVSNHRPTTRNQPANVARRNPSRPGVSNQPRPAGNSTARNPAPRGNPHGPATSSVKSQGRNHRWGHSRYSSAYGCPVYWDADGDDEVYYWCEPDDCFYPISYCPYDQYSWPDDDTSDE